MAYLRLLRDCNTTLSLVALTGYAVALQFLGKQCLEALTSCHETGTSVVFSPAGVEPMHGHDILFLACGVNLYTTCIWTCHCSVVQSLMPCHNLFIASGVDL